MLLPLDKQAHFWAGAAIASTVALYTLNPMLGFLVCAVAALLKEILDLAGFGTPDKWDFIATVLGGLVVVPLLFI